MTIKLPQNHKHNKSTKSEAKTRINIKTITIQQSTPKVITFKPRIMIKRKKSNQGCKYTYPNPIKSNPLHIKQKPTCIFTNQAKLTIQMTKKRDPDEKMIQKLQILMNKSKALPNSKPRERAETGE